MTPSESPQPASFAPTIGSSSYVPPTVDPNPSGHTGPDPVTPPQGQGQPWWRYDNPDQPTGGSYQAPPIYPGSYQAPPGPGSYQAPPGPGSYQVPPGPTLPAPTPTGPPGSRKPLIYGLVAGLVAAAVAAGVLVLTHKPTPTTPPNPGTSTTAPPRCSQRRTRPRLPRRRPRCLPRSRR